MSLRTFHDEAGRAWVATAREEPTPRHHGRWYLVFRPVDDAAVEIPMQEVRWQTAATAYRTIRTMSDFELQKRLGIVLARAVFSGGPGQERPR